MKNRRYPVLFQFITNCCLIWKYTPFVFVIFLSQQVFSQVPTISLFSPTSAASGNTVTITGTNFTGTTVVSFGGVNATSFNVVSSTSITAVVPLAVSGSVSVTTPVQTATRSGFYYLPLSGLITDFAGYWATTTASNNAVLPDNSHNLLAFTYNGTTYSTGVNNSILTGQGISYTSGNFRALPVSNISGFYPASSPSTLSIYLAMASKVDSSASVANASALAGLTIRDVMTDGANGLNMGTGITNLPASAMMTFEVHIINPAKITDGEPDIIITQIASPSVGNDVFQFIDAAGATIGNPITQDMTFLTKLGTYSLDLFNLSPGAPFNSAICYNAVATGGTNTTREIRMAGFKLSDFGITAVNHNQVAALRITPSSTSDYAFIAYSDALEMSPNIGQDIERSNSSSCIGGAVNLEVIATTAYGGALSYAWQQSVDGGTTWSTVTNGGSFSGANSKRLTIAPATNGYKYRATVTEAGKGYSSTCSPFTIAVITPTTPTAVSITASAASTCLNNLVSLSGTVTGGSNLFYRWASNASGSYVNIPDAILKTYLPPVNVTGVVSYQLTVSSGSGCTAITSSPSVITVAGIATTTPASRCGTGVVSLAATATSGTIGWYTGSTSGTLLTTANTYTPTISATTTYYLSSGACPSGARVPILATINSVVWAGTNTTDWSTVANWDCGGAPPASLPTSTSNVTIPTSPTGGRFPVVSVTAPINNITISPSASITVASGGNFEIYGSITNNGTFTATAGTISMRASAQQTIPANAFSTNTIHNLTINNTTGVLLGGELNITGTYTPTAGTLTTFGHLTLKSGINGTARVAQGTPPYIAGNLNIERYIPEQRSWRLMTSPLTNSNTIFQSWQNSGVFTTGKALLVTAPGGGTGIDASGYSSLKTWNVATQALQIVYNTKVPISLTNTGSADNTGYFIFVRGDRTTSNIDPNGIIKNVTTLTSTGFLQTGSQNFTGLSAVAGAFSLVGNPYASPVDWNLVLGNAGGTTNIKRKFYVWDPSLNTVGGYVTMDDVITLGVFVPTPATSSQNNFIQSSQALFVITNAAGAATVQFKETNKGTTNNTAIFGRPLGNGASFITNLFLLDAADSSIIPADGTRADFSPAFSAGIDDDDNLKYANVNETFGLVRNNILLATERRPSITGKDTLFFKLSKSSRRFYQLQFVAADFNDPSLMAVLEDSYTAVPLQLSLTGITKVNFVINSNAGSQAPNRFRVVFIQTAPLPVTFSSVQAFRQNESIAVKWKVENELNIKEYEVQHSPDGTHFTKITTIPASGSSLLIKAYSCLDANINSGNNFYRIKSVGFDGQWQYSGIVSVQWSQKNKAISVYPNPIANKLMNVKFMNLPAGAYTIRLSNAAGQLLIEKILEHSGGTDTKSIRLPETIKTGNYQLSIDGNDSIKISIKVSVS